MLMTTMVASIPVLAAQAQDANAIESETVLRWHAGTQPVKWRKDFSAETGCVENTENCSVFVGPTLQLSTSRGQLLWHGATIPIQNASRQRPTADFPPLRYIDPVVTLAGTPSRPQAVCLEFRYDSIWGRSGASQYWNASVLVLFGQQRQSKPVAYRIDGYDSRCSQWRSNAGGSYLLGAVEHLAPVPMAPDPSAPSAASNAADSLRLVWHQCTLRGCKTAVDARKVRWDNETRLLRTDPDQPPYLHDMPAAAP